MLRIHMAAFAAAAALAIGCTPPANQNGTGQQTPARPSNAQPAPAAGNASPSPSPSHGSTTGEAKFKNEDGTSFAVADIPGKAKVVNFWATWCAPCLHEMPLLNDLSKKYKDKDVTFVAVSVDENGPHDVKPFLDRGRVKIDFRVAYATFDELAPLNVEPPIPDTLVFDANGRLVKHIDAIVEAPELEAAIAEALGNGGK